MSDRASFSRGLDADLHHDDSDSEGALRLHAISPVDLVVDNVAALGNVPWRTLVLVVGIDCVWRSLHVESVGPKAKQRGVEQEREDW
jgi:hypothetical protein